jgi:hypothetical protein
MSKAALKPLADNLYERDFYAWTKVQARALTTREDRALDVVNLIDEVESLGRSQRAAIASRLEILIAHLLRFRVQPERASPSRRRTLREQRRQIARLIERNPSLARLPSEILPEVYRDAVHTASRETFLEEIRFPASNPFTLEQILDPDFEP